MMNEEAEGTDQDHHETTSTADETEADLENQKETRTGHIETAVVIALEIKIGTEAIEVDGHRIVGATKADDIRGLDHDHDLRDARWTGCPLHVLKFPRQATQICPVQS